VVTDINMPRLDGFGFIEAVRRDGRFGGVPILVLTTESDAEKKARARNAGATGWIVKPFDPARLFAHAFETALDLLRSGRLAPAAEVVKLLLRAADMLTDLVRAARTGAAVADAAGSARMIASLDALAAVPAPAPPVEPVEPAVPAFRPLRLDLSAIGDAEPAPEPAPIAEPPPAGRHIRIVFRPADAMYAKANETTLLLRELSRMGSLTVACDTAALPSLDALEPASSHLAWTVDLLTAATLDPVREVFEFVEGDCELSVVELSASAQADDAAGHEAAAAMEAARPAYEQDDESAPSAASPPPPPVLLPVSPLAPPPAPPGPVAATITPARAAEMPALAHASIRVDVERVDRLVDLIGELVISHSTLLQNVSEAGLLTTGVAAALDALGHLTRDIQDGTMAIRAQPLKPLFQRMSRIVREVADATGKQVVLQTEGESTEVDRTVIEKLADPLTHMIRNAIDHGLEAPDRRREAGKTEAGVLRLSAAHRSGRVIIEVSDDGAGIDRSKVRGVALSRGLIAPDAQLTDGEIDNLIFLPGFSTTDTVSSISGRGVGLDAVKRAIQALGGRIVIASCPGQGSSFTLSLPLTLALLDGMLVTAGGQTLVVPLTAIIGMLQPKQANVYQFGSGAQLMHESGSFTPVIDVARELGFADRATSPDQGVLLLVEAEGGTRRALLVEAIQDQRRVVIKSLDSTYGVVSGIAAATILGDGRIALILDVDAIASRGSGHPAGSERQLAIAG
ncbi:MAG TPA: chemotaxis protein CheW, partial [Acidisphaera sp.]|nr:chemotaxis protein CheW [Acidisphaera sp.]